ncbi:MULTISPECIES: bifunctional RNase H/acid phosphatase [unclassified Mycolicibacterium]|uniref:bifunctional RNase H/acid phosphatase n=1 Tax=unclassified Mycolicibacterium TaxID=2636767 RepID=UPI0013076414|nr:MULTISPECIES: bifunctional RNase H/acid phosphatase [unclassified Mycolicibacterium]MUL83792.1 bifunctional RNase H/acid phosphatase [Mycolicibacterium sp. CBMA 329]MUL90783.1 bifunctional RNase H/acid phosphatase [Mycolicibacterium sp. CBMA 331]MUM00751.1 bifunctional RNase H/acid phosphatase [Mycolicibacterium sp. CBMA 334]MUM29484.1 bifunctional RNase H/acid phosphatase [Mycolicibacterium sp. CBMA 295]MUM41727.1 bifunctional RNase H/acid phosphatase [Mycolicibacterium sp. CBMA 247]
MKVLVEADGGSRGNPGPAGYGAVVFDSEHAVVLAERKEAIGRATNNVAEYRGLIAGLEAATELGAAEVAVSMDSKLLVEQMSGRWRVKHPDLIPLQRQAAGLAAGLERVSYTWIPRARNSHADRLANEAMDAAAGIVSEKPAETPAAEPAKKTEEPEKPSPPGWTGATGEPTRLLLLRHGQTELSIARRYSGRGNPALTEEGRRQADAAARYLVARGGIAAVVTSPLERAYETATAVAKALGVDVRVDEDLIETDFGAWEGLTFAEAAQRDPELHRRWLRDTSVEPPGGESFDAVAHRVRRARNRIIAEYGAATVLVVSHVTPIKTILRLALDAGEGILYRLHLDLASLSIAEFYADGGSSVRLVNQTAYL